MAATLISDSAGIASKNPSPNTKINPETSDQIDTDTPEGANDLDWWLKNSQRTLMAKEELFYHHHMDIRSWTELRDTTLYFARNAYASFFQNNHHEFNRNFELTSMFSVYYHNACRLLKAELIKNNAKRNVKRLLNRMTEATSAISINGNLFFNSPQRFDISFSSSLQQHQQEQLRDRKHKRSVESICTTIQDPFRVSVSTLSPLQSDNLDNFNISSSDLLLNQDPQLLDSKSKTDREDRYGSVLSSYTIQAHSMAVDENSNISIQALFQTIDGHFSRLLKCIRDLDSIMKSSLSGGDVLPQLFPRFFRDCFNGGAWTSAFQDKCIAFSPRSSLASFGSPLAATTFSNVTANAFGSISSKAGTIDSSVLSRSTFDNDRCSTFRDSSKAKIGRKNTKYPLDEETLVLLKKKLDYFASTRYLES